VGSLSWHEFTGAEFCPFAHFWGETFTTDYIPLHLDFFGGGADIDIDSWLDRLKIWIFRQMGLLVLVFYGVVGETAIDIYAINTNTHGHTSKRVNLFVRVCSWH